ncbi:molybdenum cofactor guanylyltransferase [Mycolicibacterium frederiksbergense]|uniref:molybdenum cofactor guanylyltransferase n=1 Tax=Mycolicibacterium frederiksbergense TaxID=117567 RepID=UPI0021F2ECC9|nr:molybdenum cofactor guanylyltransferase [Mycolicibacterium frederiksbergense]
MTGFQGPSADAGLAGIVLAGGASRRMGRDKATLVVRGQTLVERVVSTVGTRCAPVFVIAAPGQALPDLPAQVLRDEVRGLGPLLATARGLRAAADAGGTWAFVCAVDMPHLDAGIIDELTEAAASSVADVVLPWDGRDHYLAGLYRTALAARADELVAAGERSMRALVDAADTQRIVMEQRRELTNVNTPQDLD